MVIFSDQQESDFAAVIQYPYDNHFSIELKTKSYVKCYCL